MAYEFTENLVIEFPNVDEKLALEFSEGESTNKGLIVEVAAIHSGKTANHNHYSQEELEKAVETWIKPYPKPILRNHDPLSEPVGRVMAAKMDVEDDGTPYTRLQLAITDPSAIERVNTRRYLTGSVGGKADEALCNICGENWANSSMASMPCKHTRGKSYKGKVAEINMKNITWKEYSWVNMPADSRSGVREPSSTAESESTLEEFDDDAWVRPARVFSLSMDNEEIVEFTESEDKDVLSHMKKKDSTPLYMQIKGAFLSALAAQEEEEEVDEEQEEDILDVSDKLSQSLAQEVTNEPAPLRPEGQEKTKTKDIDPERSTGAPINRASEDGDVTAEDKEVDETDLSEVIKTLESRVEELETLVATAETEKSALSEENAKLKTALKRNLVERVVDTKITLGIVEQEERASQIEAHVNRSASSLADSLRDLIAMPSIKKVIDYTKVPTIEDETKSLSVGQEKKEPIYVPAEAIELEKKKNPEDVFVDVFMGRRKI